MREKIIKNGVRNLKEFGYPDATEENILTDLIYSGMFLMMLKDNLGKGFDSTVKPLISEVEANYEKACAATSHNKPQRKTRSRK